MEVETRSSSLLWKFVQVISLRVNKEPVGIYYIKWICVRLTKCKNGNQRNEWLYKKMWSDERGQREEIEWGKVELLAELRLPYASPLSEGRGERPWGAVCRLLPLGFCPTRHSELGHRPTVNSTCATWFWKPTYMVSLSQAVYSVRKQEWGIWLKSGLERGIL